MTVNQQELLSAFIDGELNANELDQLMVLLNEDEQSKEDIMRYQFTSDVMHGYSSGKHFVDLSTRVSMALENEAPLSAELELNKTQRSNVIRVPDWLWKQSIGFAAAASIGALAVLGVINTDQINPSETVVAEANTEQAVNPNRWTVGEAEVEDRLNNYLVDHNEYAGASGLFSYARVVSYGEE